MQSPLSAGSSSLSRGDYGQNTVQSGIDQPNPKNTEKTTDPRIRMRNLGSASPAAASSTLASPAQHSRALSVNNDGASDLPTTAQTPDVDMIDLERDGRPDSHIAAALLPSLQFAVTLGINQVRLDSSRRHFEDAKKKMELHQASQIYDSEAFYSKVQKEKLQDLQLVYQSSLEFQRKTQAEFTTSTTQVAKVLSALIELKAQSQVEDRIKRITDNSEKQLQSLQEDIKLFRASLPQQGQIASLEQAQAEFRDRLAQAQPQVEENIRFLKTQNNIVNTDVKKIQEEMVRLRTEQGSTDSTNQLNTLLYDVKALQESQISRLDLNALKAELSSRPAPNEQQVNQLASHVASVYSDVDKLRNELGTNYPKRFKDSIDTVNKRIDGPNLVRQQELTRVKELIDTLTKRMDQQAAEGNSKVNMAAHTALHDQTSSIQKDLQDIQSKLSEFEGPDLTRRTIALEERVSTMQRNNDQSPQTTDTGASYELLRAQIEAQQAQLNEQKEQAESLAQKMTQLASRPNQGAERDDSTSTSLVDQKPSRLETVPDRLSAKERHMLGSVESLLTRVHQIETTVFQLFDKEPTSHSAMEAGDPENNLSELVTQVTAIESTLHALKNETVVGIETDLVATKDDVRNLREKSTAVLQRLDQVSSEVSQQVIGCQNGLHQLEQKSRTSHENITQSVEKVGADLRATNHSLQSLTTRYNNINTEDLARQVMSITLPLSEQLKNEQNRLREQVDKMDPRLIEIQGRVDELKKTVDDIGVNTDEELKDGQKRLKEQVDQMEPKLAEFQYHLDDVKKSLGEVDGEQEQSLQERFKELQGNVVSERDGLFKLHKKLDKQCNEHAARLSTLEEWVAHKKGGPPEREDEEEGEEEEDANLIERFQPHTEPSASRLKLNTNGIRFPPPPTSTGPRQGRSLGDRITTPSSVASPPMVGRKRALEKDHFDDAAEDMIVVEHAPARATPTDRGSRPKGKKAQRLA